MNALLIAWAVSAVALIFVPESPTRFARTAEAVRAVAGVVALASVVALVGWGAVAGWGGVDPEDVWRR